MRFPAFDPCEQDHPAPVPCGAGRVKVGTPSVVSHPSRFPWTSSRACLVDRECHALSRAPFSPRGWPSLRASARRAERLRASASKPTRLATRRASWRAMRWTDFCHLTSSYEHPRLVGSWAGSRAFAHALPAESPGSRQGDSLRRPAPYGCGSSWGRCLPVAMCADAPRTSLSRLSRLPPARADGHGRAAKTAARSTA